MKLMSARPSLAPAPKSTEKRAPAIRVDRSKSRIPSWGPMSQWRLDLEVERRRIAHAPNLLVVGFAHADRDALVREVGQRQGQRVTLSLDLVEFFFLLLDLFGVSLTCFEKLLRGEPFPLRLGDLSAELLALSPSALENRQDLTARGVEPNECVQPLSKVSTAVRETSSDVLESLPQQYGIKHRVACPFRASFYKPGDAG